MGWHALGSCCAKKSRAEWRSATKPRKRRGSRGPMNPKRSGMTIALLPDGRDMPNSRTQPSFCCASKFRKLARVAGKSNSRWPQKIKSSTRNALAPDGAPALVCAPGLRIKPRQCYTSIAGAVCFNRRGGFGLAQPTPGCTLISSPGATARAVETTFGRINDPWDRDPGTPGQSRHISTRTTMAADAFLQFSSSQKSMSRPQGFQNVSLQILHA